MKSQFDRDLERALAVEPSPEFTARVRVAISRAPAPVRFAPRLVKMGAIAAATVSVVLAATIWPRHTDSDESVATPEDATYRPQGIPSFRTFSISGNSLILRDGETGQLTTAADPVTGELMRVDVTFSIVK